MNTNISAQNMFSCVHRHNERSFRPEALGISLGSGSHILWMPHSNAILSITFKRLKK